MVNVKWTDTWGKIRAAYYRLKKQVIGAGIGAALMALFTGHIFICILVAGVTYIFWRDKKGQDRFVGTET